MSDFKVRAVMCSGCGGVITVTRKEKPDRCNNPHCPSPDELG